MMTNQWDSLYKTAFEKGLQRIQSVKGVCCAFHSVIDGRIHVTPQQLEPLVENNPSLKKAALSGCKGSAPIEINTPEDFMQGLFCSLSQGIAMQHMIRLEKTYQWVMDTFGPGQYCLGGTAGNMARSLAPLGIPVTVYANPLTIELAELLGDYPNLNVIRKNGETFFTCSPKEAARENGIFAIHWIFEYSTDFVMELDGLRIQPHRANRYIPSWNPVNNQFRMDMDFARGFLDLIESYSHLLFSGFHILSERYPDGTTCIDVINPLSKFLQTLRQLSSTLKIHLELASIASPLIRKAMADSIIPYVHSIGLNETELPLFVEPFSPSAGQDIKQSPTLLNHCHALETILNHTNVERIHFHNLGYHLCLEKNPWTSHEASRNALLLSATMAAARAGSGLFTCMQDIEKGLSTPIENRGFEELNRMAESLNQPRIAETGMGTYHDYLLTMIPTRLVKNPLFTAGLGDTISSGAFLTT